LVGSRIVFESELVELLHYNPTKISLEHFDTAAYKASSTCRYCITFILSNGKDITFSTFTIRNVFVG